MQPATQPAPRHGIHWSVAVLLVALDIAFFLALCRRLSQELAAAVDPISWAAVGAAALVLAGTGLAALVWAVGLGLAWAGLGHVLAYLALAAGLAPWLLPAGFLPPLGGQMAAFAVALVAWAGTRRLHPWPGPAPFLAPPFTKGRAP